MISANPASFPTGKRYRPVHLEVRPMTQGETPRATEWAVREGWNPGASDVLVFDAIDPGSLLTVEAEGRPAGVISAVRMSPSFGFIGFFVLAPEFRRSVHGWKLWQAALHRMGDRAIGGDGVLTRLRHYQHHGFTPHYQTVTHVGVAPARRTTLSPGLMSAGSLPLAELAAYDAAATGLTRTACLREWLALPDSLALACKRAGRLCGLGAARVCHQGVRIGPLEADDPEVAEALFDALSGLAPGEPLSMDCPETNPEAAKLAQRKGLVPRSVTARFYRGEPPVGLAHRVYGQMSFALG